MRGKKKIIENVTIGPVAAEGKCVVKTDEKVIFIEGVAPGDVADIQITKKKKSYLEGKAIRLHALSDERAEPFCQHFGICGGCKWQHLDYTHQLRYKKQQVIDNFQRIGKLTFPPVNDMIASDRTTFYRNKLEFTFSNKRWLSKEEIRTMEKIDRDGLGFHIPLLFDKVVDIEHCHLQEDPSNHIRNTIRKYVREEGFGFYEIAQHRGFLRNLIIRTATTGELMIIVQFGEFQEENISKIMHFIINAFPELTSLYYIINKKGNETYHDQELIHVHGEKFIIEKIGDFSFRIGPKSFFQTNTFQAEKLYRKAKEMAALQGNETVYDLYTGTGTIANYMADAAGRVVGIEIIDEAIHDARINSEINDIHNTVFLTGDIKETLNEDLFRQYGSPDVVITDPPRAGMHADVVETLLKIKPKKIVYISCNPATQARDLALLCEDYSIKEIQPVDMFPHTHHLENIVSLYLNTHDNNE